MLNVGDRVGQKRSERLGGNKQGGRGFEKGQKGGDLKGGWHPTTGILGKGT